MHGTPWSDGTPGVSSGWIMGDTTGTISFTAGPAGTHFYGATGLHGARGLKGAFIVKPKTETRSSLYHEEMLMQIADNWREPEVCLTYDGVSQKPLCPPIDKVTFDGMWGDGSKIHPFPSYTVDAGKCYRLRMVGLMSQVQRLNVSIEGHSLTLLAVDGTEVEPVDVSSIALHAGERYDFKFCT